MRPVANLLLALLRILWPFTNARTREIVGTVLTVLAALAYGLSEAVPAIIEATAPTVAEAPAPLPAAPVALEAPPVVEPDATPSIPPDGTGDGAALGLEVSQ